MHAPYSTLISFLPLGHSFLSQPLTLQLYFSILPPSRRLNSPFLPFKQMTNAQWQLCVETVVFYSILPSSPTLNRTNFSWTSLIQKSVPQRLRSISRLIWQGGFLLKIGLNINFLSFMHECDFFKSSRQNSFEDISLLSAVNSKCNLVSCSLFHIFPSLLNLVQ